MKLWPQWYGWLVSGWDRLRGSFWMVPALMAVGAALLAMVLLEVDTRLGGAWIERIPWLHAPDPPGIRAVVSTIAGSMITVTGVVFSITVVALTLASSQFGPRLLRSFLRDRGTQVALGTFIATFLYSLLVLRAIEDEASVPHVAAAGAMALATASLFVLIYFIHHVASSIQASNVIAAVSHELQEQIPHLFPERVGEARDDADERKSQEQIERLEADGVEVCSGFGGYLRYVDGDAALELACEHDLLVWLDARPGDFVGASCLLALVGPKSRVDDEVIECLHDCFQLGEERTAVQDLGFLTDQLAEVAVRALSPGVNDPQTAIRCTHRIGDALARIAERSMPSALRYDDDGALRVIARPLRFAEVVASCIDPIRRHGSSDAQVVQAALEALAMAARCCSDPDRLAVLAEHGAELRECFDRGPGAESSRDASQVARVHETLREVLESRHSSGV